LRIERANPTGISYVEGDIFLEGGKAIYNTKDLAGAALQAIDFGNNYYTIVYTPPNQTKDRRRRSITVKIDQPDLTLNYNHNYHALPPGILVNGKVVERATPLQTAMLRGTLQPTEILFLIDHAIAKVGSALLSRGKTAFAITLGDHQAGVIS